jgi:hypothetical protein
MSRFGFCSGGTYSLPLVNASCQRCVNWYPQTIETGDKSAMILLPTPGLSVFAGTYQTIYNRVRGLWTINGRTFAVLDNWIYELFSNGTFSPCGKVQNDGNPAYMVASANQLFVSSGGNAYVYTLQTFTSPSGTPYNAGQFVPIPSTTFPGPVTKVGWIDGFFMALVGPTTVVPTSPAQFWVSNVGDATTWTQNGAKIPSVFPDNAVAVGFDHRELWVLGPKQSEVEYDSGNTFPFDTIPGGFIEQGCAAPNSVTNLDNGLFWLGGRNDQGWGIAWRSNGYSAVRVSNHAIEQTWSSYSTIADAIGFSFVRNGHSIWQLNFPTANASWRYDVATGLWHEVDFWNLNTGAFGMHRANCHTFNFGMNLVGDRFSGGIYQMSDPAMVGSSWNFCTDFGNPIRRMRRAPHISIEQQWIRHNWLQVDVETGVGPQPPLLDGAGEPRGPRMTLCYSDDGGHTWKGHEDKSVGQAGDFRHRLIWRRKGRSRDRVYELTGSDPVPYRIVDAYLDADPAYKPQERLVSQAAKVA